VLGVCCAASDVTATVASVSVFGWLLLIGGVFEFFHAFRAGTWSGFPLYLLGAFFRGFTGFLLIRYPVMGAEALTVVLASFSLVAGLFRAIALAIELPRWSWVVFSGVITAVLGFILLAQMPISSIWFAIGVDLIFDGNRDDRVRGCHPPPSQTPRLGGGLNSALDVAKRCPPIPGSAE
jgi:uncharacterized membrane protein HdeD (DUF308 family)